MKNKKNIIWIIAIICAVGLFIGAVFLYNYLSEEYKPDSLPKVKTVDTDKKENDSEEEKSQNNGEEETQKYQAPDFMVYDKDGNEVKLSDYRGKPVVLNFWATWCYYCKEEMPDFNEAYKKYPEIQFLMVNATDGEQETEEAAKDYVKEQGFEFPVFYDKEQEAVYAYRVSGFPATFFIDKDGNLVTYATGMLDSETLDQGIEILLDAM